MRKTGVMQVLIGSGDESVHHELRIQQVGGLEYFIFQTLVSGAAASCVVRSVKRLLLALFTRSRVPPCCHRQFASGLGVGGTELWSSKPRLYSVVGVHRILLNVSYYLLFLGRCFRWPDMKRWLATDTVC